MFHIFSDTKKVQPSIRFELTYTEEERRIQTDVFFQEQSKGTKDYVNKLPLIIEPSSTAGKIKIGPRCLVPKTFTIFQLKTFIYNNLTDKTDSNHSLFITVGTVTPYVPRNDETVESLYNKYKNSDMYLYITYHKEDFYG